MRKINLAIFASGSGSNAENICTYFKNSDLINIELIVTNNPNAYVIERAKKLNVKYKLFSKNQFNETNEVLNCLENNSIDYVILAGFLLLVPKNIISRFNNKIINIHPALLPKFGGKGMYGDFVHKAVIESNEHESGITIHYVNEHYDEGNIIFQAKCQIEKCDDYKSLAEKIHALEFKHFPQVIEKLILK